MNNNRISARRILLAAVSATVLASAAAPSHAEQQVMRFYLNALTGNGNSGATYSGPGYDQNAPVVSGETQSYAPGGHATTYNGPGVITSASGNGFGTAGAAVNSPLRGPYDGYGGIGMVGVNQFGGLSVTRRTEATLGGRNGETSAITSAFSAAGVPNAGRFINTFTNSTGATISGDILFSSDLGSDRETQYVQLGTNNRYAVSIKSVIAGTPFSAHVVQVNIYGNNGYTEGSTQTRSDGSPFPTSKYTISVAPGETVRLVLFTVVTADVLRGNTTDADNNGREDALDADIALATQLAELITNGGNPISRTSPFFVGMTDAEISSILNFDFAPGYARQELYSNAAMLSAGQVMGAACRGGGADLSNAADASVARGGWSSASAGSFHTGASSGVGFSQNYECGQAGLDMVAKHGWRVGLGIGLGKTSLDVTVPQGVGKLDGDAYSVEAYAKRSLGKAFVSATAGYGRFDWNYSVANTVSNPSSNINNLRSDGLYANTTVGIVTPIKGSYALTSLVRVNYDGINCGSNCMIEGSREQVANWTATASTRLAGSMFKGTLLPYAELNLSQNLAGINKVTLGTDTLRSDIQKSRVGMNIGFKSIVNDTTSVSFELRDSESLVHRASDYGARISARTTW